MKEEIYKMRTKCVLAMMIIVGLSMNVSAKESLWFEVIEPPPEPVIDPNHPDLAGNK